MYFTLSKAKRLITKDYSEISGAELQKDYVKLRDFTRYIEDFHWDEHAAKTLLAGGYFKIVSDPYAKGFVPADLWLYANLKTALNIITARKEQGKWESR